MIKLIVTALVLMLNISLFAQCYTKNTVFKAGEILDYKVYYNLGFIWTEVGHVWFKVTDAVYNGKHVLLLSSYGGSDKSYKWIFDAEDNYRTYIESSELKPIYHLQNTNENGHKVNNKYIFDQVKQQVFMDVNVSKAKPVKDTLKITPCTTDLLTAVYYARIVDYPNLKQGYKIPLKVLIDDKINDIHFRYLGIEAVETKNNKTYKAYKIKPLIVQTTMFEGGENMTVWLSADANRVPVMIEAKLWVGSVKVILNNYSGLRYPFNN